MYHYTANIIPRGGGIWNLTQTPRKVWCLKVCFFQHRDLSGVLAKHHGKIVVLESNTTISPNTTDKQHEPESFDFDLPPSPHRQSLLLLKHIVTILSTGNLHYTQ